MPVIEATEAVLKPEEAAMPVEDTSVIRGRSGSAEDIGKTGSVPLAEGTNPPDVSLALGGEAEEAEPARVGVGAMAEVGVGSMAEVGVGAMARVEARVEVGAMADVRARCPLWRLCPESMTAEEG